MTIYNLGSINADIFYRVPWIPSPGETLASDKVRRGLGGKGANMSVAAARAGSKVVHIGAVGGDGGWAVGALGDYGVTPVVDTVSAETGHAIIMVADDGENAIILHPGANQQIPEASIVHQIEQAVPGDIFVTQNETNGQFHGAELARRAELVVAYAAAPFDPEAVARVLPFLDILFLNQIEAQQLEAAMGITLADLPVDMVLETRGGDGCVLHEPRLGRQRSFPAPVVVPVDTTGAGDTFTGYFLAALDAGQKVEEAVGIAQAAAAVMVTRHGTADVIPTMSEVRMLKT